MSDYVELFKGRRAAHRVVAVIGGGLDVDEPAADDSLPTSEPTPPSTAVTPAAVEAEPVSRRALRRRG